VGRPPCRRTGRLTEGSEPVNLGAGREITIKSLVTVLCDLIGYEGQIRWDTTKPRSGKTGLASFRC
jgi:hypothetical protein